jgi:predicted ArsR family transcriptional regulator
MATIDDLKKSISEMSDEELMEQILESRKRRRQPNPSRRQKSVAEKKVKEVTKSLTDFQKMLAMMPKDQQLEILKKLETS